ncbi:MAG: F0F1 ATP synthase subunit epsilon [Rhodanobacteraceae bacterium]|nr:F0F1 ATP synthase subunit epsilon [Xanthomonadales bacterium]MCP5478015.1 F0F1 ATP synthase subunit epsilon [Rhodanobacteraceae bacterium]
MKLVVSTPLEIVVEDDDVAHVRAEDASGAFGILRGHADFLTALSVSVLSWRDLRGRERHVALRGGVLEVRDGERVEVASREAVAGDDLRRLQDEVLRRFRSRQETEQSARSDAQRLYLAAIRQIYSYLRGTPPPAFPRVGDES